jgi:hypothetical protein
VCDNKRKNDSFIFYVSCISCVWCASAWFCVYDGFSFGVLQWRELAALQQLHFCRPKGQTYYLEEEEQEEQEEEQEEQEEEQEEQEEEQEEEHLHQVLILLLLPLLPLLLLQLLLRHRKKTKV